MKSLPNKIVLVDFGATRVKSVLVDTLFGAVIDSVEVDSPSRKSDSDRAGYFEVAAEKYQQAFEQTALTLLRRNDAVNAIYICSEMHGFALLNKNTNTVSPYISWKDTRVNINSYEHLAPGFFEFTAMKLRPGLPFLNLKLAVAAGQDYKFLTLVDAVLTLSGCTEIKTDLSLAASTGLVDLNKKEWSRELCPFNNVEFTELNLDVAQPIAKLGSVNIYGGIGDLQAAVLGAGLNDNAVFNLGTGSQVICKDQQIGHELRPYVHGNLRVITHIPSGRALNIIAEFFNSIADDSTFFWQHWANLSADDVFNAQDCVDLNMFEAAWQYNAASGFIKFREGRSDFKSVLADIAKSWAMQYISALNKLDPEYKQTTVTVSGGLAHKSKFLIDVLSRLDANRTYNNSTITLAEETLEGLYNLYLLNENSSNRS